METNSPSSLCPALVSTWAKLSRALLLIALLAAFGSLKLAAQTTNIAYVVPTNTVGNQNLGGTTSVGSDFDVDNEIIVTRLGVFDENSDGLKLPITARLWDRATVTQIASIDFTPEDQGELIGGSRFKALPAPIHLVAGFQGTISVDGYGLEERIFNSHGSTAAVTWTLNDGGGSIRFVGTSRYGAVGEFPVTPDGGPPARYAAGTFEFQTTPATLPGPPTVSIQSADQEIVLSWAAVTVPAPAVKYRISRGTSPDGPFAQIAETTQTSYTNSGVANGTAYSYIVEGITQAGKSGPASAVKTAAGYALAANHFIAYFTPPGISGNQAFGGSLGMDFDIQNPIMVTRLGVFDDDSDGLKLTLTARIYNRDTQESLAEVSFTPEDPGVLIGGMRFKALTAPLPLPVGFHGVIQADGYGPEEPLRNSGGNTNGIFWTLHDANGSVQFVGRSRYGSFPGAFPETVDGGPAARYAAGTFEFQSTPPEAPGVPQLTVVQPFEDRLVTLNWQAVTNPLPAAKYEIERTGPDGVAAKLGETTETTFLDTSVTNGSNYCYRVRSVAAGGQLSGYSISVCATPDALRGGIAYLVPADLVGNQNLAQGAVGMDFNVAHPIKVTQLGVFDDSSDGLTMELTAVLYDRAARKAMATLVFTPENSGELNGGSRFLPLAEPLILDEGFQGSMVIWYSNGTSERLYNTFGNPNPAVADLQTFGGGSLVFVGASRYGSAGTFPATVDTGPVNRYAGGTFAFEPTVIQRPTFIAYAVPTNTVGNQDVTGASIGMDFDVKNEIIVTRLGVLDDGSDGIKQNLTAKLWDRNPTNPAPVLLGTVQFTTAEPGDLIGGSRFKALSKALRLRRGFQGTIATEGFGALEKIRNSSGNAANVTWTLNDGNGSIAFVGGGRYGGAPGYPATADGGPAARYAAGTFEFQTTPPSVPGQPVVTVRRPFEEGAVTLTWLAVNDPLPAVKYEILRAKTADGQFTKIGETTELTFRDTTVQNGTPYSYAVRAIAAGGEASDNSTTVFATPNPPQGGIAYIVPEGLAGNQNVAGSSLGMDFDIVSPIKITRLGVFDGGGDGLLVPVTAAIFDRSSTAQPLVTLEFTPESPGDLFGGSRFKPLPSPLTLNAGFQGSIVTWGYDTTERMFNTFGNPLAGNLQVFDGGVILFVGGSRYGANATFPATVDGGPPNRYATGTFEFELAGANGDPLPVLQVLQTGGNIRLTWTGGGTLQRTTTLGGTWQPVQGAASGIELPITGGSSFFRVVR